MPLNAPLINKHTWRAIAKTRSYSVQGQDTLGVFHNLNATGNITLSLPKAGNSTSTAVGGPGLEYEFLVSAAHTITVTPVSTDTIRGKATGASASNATVGNYLKLKCVIPGYWEVLLNNGAW